MNAAFKLMSVAEAAEILAVSAKQVRRLIDSGKIRTIRMGQSKRSDRIHPDDLQSFINTSRQCRSVNVEPPGKSWSPTVAKSIVDLVAGGTALRRVK